MDQQLLKAEWRKLGLDLDHKGTPGNFERILGKSYI
jgi:hypothetical protein